MLLAAVFVLSGCGGDERPDGETPPRPLPPELVEEAEARGTVLVVVALAADGRAEIAEAQEALLGALGEHGEVAGRPERVPQLALRVDAEGLEILARSPYVRRVEPNEPEPPAGPGS